MKILIVGGVAGGATAGARIRRLDESAEIIIFERSGYISYANCGLPYYIGGVIEDESALTVQTAEGYKKRFNIDVRVLSEVIDIDVENKNVRVKNLATEEEYVEGYDKLILSPGARPILPDFYFEDDRVFTLRTVEDTKRISAFITQKQPKNAVVIGGGFIGIEMAENLIERGIGVKIIQRSEHLLPTVDKDLASFIHAEMRRNGVEICLNSNTTDMKREGDRIILTVNGEEIITDAVFLCVGVVPENTLAKKIGLKLGIKGAICVDEEMKTSVEDVYAVGDAIEVKHPISHKNAVISLAGPANKQGRIVADNVLGGSSKYKGTIGASVIKIFSLTVASVGLNEAIIKESGVNYEKVILSPTSHAGYYPSASPTCLKVIYSKDTHEILGASMVGYEGVDKRIDVISTAIQGGIKATELMNLELAYAPPYSSAKDPVNMAGFIIDNIVKGRVKQFYYEDIPLISHKNAIFLDTRTAEEYRLGHAEGFINIPLDSLRQRLGELDNNKSIYVMCQSGLRSYLANRILAQNGFDCYNFTGGYRLYSAIYNEQILSKKCSPCGGEI